jgi:hydrogenase assembly chaperone HypC/HupF
MCIGFPGIVVALDSDGAIVETEGRRRRASTLFLTDIAIGDWVTVAAGTVVERLEPDQAADIRTMLRVAMTAALNPTTEGSSDVHTP